MTILLVEDDPNIRELLTRLLERDDYRVMTATSGEEAESLAQTDSVDLLVCDVCLPGVSGPVLARRLAASQPTLRTLLMSGDPSLDDLIDEGLDAEFLGKPFTTGTFIQNVRSLLAR
ncbi:MAG: response regulator [Acidimicrobiia bacterium]|nr:response regulator [Acidimicrobiia bacterium]